MQPTIALDRISEDGAVGRMLRLICEQFGFGRKRQPRQIKDIVDILIFACVEAISRQNFAQQISQALRLPIGKLGSCDVVPRRSEHAPSALGCPPSVLHSALSTTLFRKPAGGGERVAEDGHFSW